MLRANMKKIFVIFVLLFATSAYAQNEIDVCNNCKIVYQTKKVVKKVAVVPAQPVYAPVGTMPAGPGPISSTYEVPVDRKSTRLNSSHT